MENIKSANVKISNQAKLKIKMSDKNDKDILSSKDTKSSKLKTYGIFLTGLGAVGLATFMILKKRGKIKTANLKARKNTKDSVSKNQNGALNVTEEIQDIKNKIQYDTAMVAQEMPVDSSDYNYSAQSQIQKYNNRLRLLSFVAVFEREAYIFIRLPKNIASRRDIEDLKEIANDIALDLDMRTSSFQPYINNQNLGLGYVSRGKYEVMRLA